MNENPDPNPQVLPTLFKRYLRAAGVGLFVGGTAFAVLANRRVYAVERRLDKLGQRVLRIETIYDAEEALEPNPDIKDGSEGGTDL
jgi:hypothetical protein